MFLSTTPERIPANNARPASAILCGGLAAGASDITYAVTRGAIILDRYWTLLDAYLLTK